MNEEKKGNLYHDEEGKPGKVIHRHADGIREEVDVPLPPTAAESRNHVGCTDG